MPQSNYTHKLHKYLHKLHPIKLQNYTFLVESTGNVSNYFSRGFLGGKKAGKDQVLMARGACLIPFGPAVLGGWGRSSPV